MKPPSSSWNRPTTTSANLLPTMIPTTALLTEPTTPPPGREARGTKKERARPEPELRRAPLGLHAVRRRTREPGVGLHRRPAPARRPASLLRGRQLIEPPAGY